MGAMERPGRTETMKKPATITLHMACPCGAEYDVQSIRGTARLDETGEPVEWSGSFVSAADFCQECDSAKVRQRGDADVEVAR